MTTAELMKDIGKTGRIILHSLSIRIQIIDARLRYGNPDYLITPDIGSTAGLNCTWVDSRQVRIDE